MAPSKKNGGISLRDNGYHQIIIEPDKANSAKAFPWVNRTLSNAKKMLLNMHYSAISQEYIQNYLNEFYYKLNRRYFGDKLFDLLMISALETTWY